MFKVSQCMHAFSQLLGVYVLETSSNEVTTGLLERLCAEYLYKLHLGLTLCLMCYS